MTSIDELNAILIPQGFKVVMHYSEEAEDVKFRPIPVDEQVRRLRAAIDGLSGIAKQMGVSQIQHEKTIDQVFNGIATNNAITELENLFGFYGSDKASTHDYHRVYAALLEPIRHKPVSILEIGLGTNNIDVLSNMGLSGKPGASLRAFRDWLPEAMVFGADIDERVLFAEERIETYFVDQTKPKTLRELSARFEPHSFDLIIDDGLHIPEANINSVNFALGLLKDTGVLVIEDIGEEFFDFWYTAFALLGSRYTCHFLKTKAACMVLIGRNLVKID